MIHLQHRNNGLKHGFGYASGSTSGLCHSMVDLIISDI